MELMERKQDDWDLAERTMEGDREAFESLMHRYRRPILGFVYRMLNDPRDAEDIAQEVFAKAYWNLCDGKLQRKTGAFSTWLFRVARNMAIDRLRKRARRPEQSLNDLEGSGWDSADGTPDPSGAAVNRELSREIAAAVAALPEKQRTVLILYEYEDLSYGQIADIMRVNEKSVESRLYRARRFLRRRLAGHLS